MRSPESIAASRAARYGLRRCSARVRGHRTAAICSASISSILLHTRRSESASKRSLSAVGLYSRSSWTTTVIRCAFRNAPLSAPPRFP